jgi:hypothetical protein
MTTNPTKTPTKPKTRPSPPAPAAPCSLPPCPTAHSPRNTCRCSCRGVNHGRNGRYA